MGQLIQHMPRSTIAIVAGYRGEHTIAAVALTTIGDDDQLRLHFPKRNPFREGEPVLVYLDDRVGSEIYSIELKIHRGAYRGTVTRVSGFEAWVAPDDFDLVYGTRIVAQHHRPGYEHPRDSRTVHALPVSPLKAFAQPDEETKANKLGVLITKAVTRPHATVMAFLADNADNVFLITHRETFKVHNLLRDGECTFAIDHRADFTFENQVDWNYTIYAMKAHEIPLGSALFGQVQAAFVEKNPWELAFFTNPQAVALHLVPQKIIQQDVLCLTEVW